jgi:hypothetical protein
MVSILTVCCHGKPDEQAYRAARINLRPRNARDRRQGRSACGQMQKLPSVGKFHGVRGWPCGAGYHAVASFPTRTSFLREVGSR